MSWAVDEPDWGITPSNAVSFHVVKVDMPVVPQQTKQQVKKMKQKEKKQKRKEQQEEIRENSNSEQQATVVRKKKKKEPSIVDAPTQSDITTKAPAVKHKQTPADRAKKSTSKGMIEEPQKSKKEGRPVKSCSEGSVVEPPLRKRPRVSQPQPEFNEQSGQNTELEEKQTAQAYGTEMFICNFQQ